MKQLLILAVVLVLAVLVYKGCNTGPRYKTPDQPTPGMTPTPTPNP